MNDRTMVSKKKKICLKMMYKEDQVRRVKLKQLKKRYRYATGGSGRRFFLAFALRQLRSYGKRGSKKKASTKRGAVWTVTSTSQATGLSPEGDNVEAEEVEEIVSQAKFEESVEQKEDSLDNDKVEDTISDQISFQPSFTVDEALTSTSGLRNLFRDDRSTAAFPLVQCPLLESITQCFDSLLSGELHILKDIEVHVSSNNSNCHHPPLKDLVFDGSLNGSTPLILACHYGDFYWVRRIVEHWDVDMNATAVYHHLGPLIVTPLFVAAFNGHTSIVKYLVRNGADVFFKTSLKIKYFDDYHAGMSPLYGALNQLSNPYEKMVDVTNMVRFLLESGADPNDVPSHRPPIWMSYMCGVDATTALIHHGLHLNQRNSDGESVLHHWVKAQSYWFDPKDSFDVVKLLVDNGADIMAQDNKGITVISAAVKSGNWNTIDYVLEKEGVDRMEKIEAAEMAAARILSKSYMNTEFERAFRYWRRALLLRETEPNPMQKTPLVLKSGKASEWITPDQLEYVIEHPSEYQIQSFLVRLRICLKKSWGAFLELHKDSFSDCITDLKNQGRSVDLLDVLWATLETIHLFDLKPDYDLRSMIEDVVENLITTLSQLVMEYPLLINAETFKLPLEVLVAANDFFWSDDESDGNDSDFSSWIFDINSQIYADHRNHHHMGVLLQFFALLAGLPHEILTPAVRQSVSQLVCQNSLGEDGRTLLHMACANFKAEDLPTIRLLLLSRANPNTADGYGNTPLHILACQQGNDAAIQSAAHLLLEYGAQVERANGHGETAADVWILCQEPEAGFNVPPEWCLKSATIPNLKSLCARVVRAQNLPTNELPATLIALVELREQNS